MDCTSERKRAQAPREVTWAAESQRSCGHAKAPLLCTVSLPDILVVGVGMDVCDQQGSEQESTQLRVQVVNGLAMQRCTSAGTHGSKHGTSATNVSLLAPFGTAQCQPSQGGPSPVCWIQTRSWMMAAMSSCPSLGFHRLTALR